MQEAPGAPGAVLQKSSEVCLRAVRQNRPSLQRHGPSGTREPGQEGDSQETIILNPEGYLTTALSTFSVFRVRLK